MLLFVDVVINVSSYLNVLYQFWNLYQPFAPFEKEQNIFLYAKLHIYR